MYLLMMNKVAILWNENAILNFVKNTKIKPNDRFERNQFWDIWGVSCWTEQYGRHRPKLVQTDLRSQKAGGQSSSNLIYLKQWSRLIIIRDRASKTGNCFVYYYYFSELCRRFWPSQRIHLTVFIWGCRAVKIVGAGEKFYILCVTFMSHTRKTTRWRCFWAKSVTL